MFLAAEMNSSNILTSRALQHHLFALLRSCKSSNELTQIHAQILVNGLSQKNYILAQLLSLCVASGDLIHGQKTFEQIKNPSTFLWNQMIRGYAGSRTPEKSVQFYNRMEGAGTEADCFTYSFLLTACARQSFLREGEQLHGRVISNGFLSNVFVQTNLVNMYASAREETSFPMACRVFDEMTQRNVVTWNSVLAGYLRSGDVDGARRVFDSMPERNVISWTTMVAGCAQHGRCKQALSLFQEMQRANVELDQVALVAALSACAELGDLKMGRWIHSYIQEASCIRNQPRLVSLNNALMHMYASCGVIDEAYRVFKEMSLRSRVSWTTMITGFAKQGCGEEALSVFQWMQRVGVKQGARPDEITFIGVLCACSHTGWVDEGRHYFKLMTQDFGIEPRIEHYGCMVDLLSRAGLLDEAHKLIESMPMEPNDVVWGTLLGGCRIYRDADLAMHVARRLEMELEPDRAAGYLVLLSNVYATAKRWDDVATVRQRMIQMGVRKPPGRSWIQVNGVIHDFVAGDQTHKHAFAIYEMVGEIARRAKLEGHIPDTSEVLLDVEEEEQERFLYLHSEKLAIAFGLISIPDTETPIRIVKNLRICSDCHSIAKFVSKIFDREISIRDRNRFHHFKGGTCSCNGYW